MEASMHSCIKSTRWNGSGAGSPNAGIRSTVSRAETGPGHGFRSWCLPRGEAEGMPGVVGPRDNAGNILAKIWRNNVPMSVIYLALHQHNSGIMPGYVEVRHQAVWGPPPSSLGSATKQFGVRHQAVWGPPPSSLGSA